MIFNYVVFTILAMALFLATGAAIHMGIFKARGREVGAARKGVTAIVSYVISGFCWCLAYGYHYLGW